MDNDGIQDASHELADLEPEVAPKRRHPGRWIVGVVAIVAIAGATVALTNKDDTKSPTVVLSEAASRTTSSGTAHVSLTASVTADGHTIKVIDGEGAVDYRAKENALTLKTGGNTEEVRVVGGVSYLELPGADLPRGAHWIAISAADAKLDPTATAAIGSNDPSSGLQFLAAVDGDPRVVDKSELEGIEVTHYAFSVNLKKYFDDMGAAAKALKASSLGASIEAFGSYVDLSSIPGEAWIDGSGRVRKFKIVMKGSLQGDSFNGFDEFHFSHFDEPVDIQAPPASDTVAFHDVPNFFEQLGGSATSGQAG